MKLDVRKFLAGLLSLFIGCSLAPAFTPSDAATAFTAYNNAFLSGGAYPGWWTGAETIEMAEDAYDNSPTAARQTIVSNACNGFISANGSSWTYDIYNDDMSWAVIAFARASLITGSTNFRSIAKSNWDAMYARAWDTNYLGGGLWWNTDNTYKNAAVNGPGAVAALYLYDIYGDSSYLAKAQAIYAWERRVLLNTGTGSIADGITYPNTTTSGGPTTYNQGTFIGAANLLYRATGLPAYYQDAILVGKYTQNSMTTAGILPQYSSASDLSGFNGIFCRWMAHFAKDQNIWPSFGPWLTTNANAAWSIRNSNNLAWQKWSTPMGTNAPDVWGCTAAVIVMQVADTTPLDSLRITPTAGFTAVSQYSLLPNSTNLALVLTNTGAAALNWSLSNTSAWLSVSAASGTLAPSGPNTNITISLIPSATTNLSAGRYYATIGVTNLSSGLTQNRLFLLAVSGGSAPILMSGYNAALLAPNTAMSGAAGATAFDIVNNYCFCQAGLNGATRGLPPDGVFTSLADSSTVFQLQPYGTTNSLMIGYQYPASGTLTLATPQSYNFISVLACSANTSGNGGIGTLVLNFTNGTHSPALNFNAQDWFNTTSNVAIQGFGRLALTGLSVQDNGTANPNLYQTTINLAALGLTQPISSITFTKSATAGAQQDTGIFAVSGTVMPAAANIVNQPQSVTNTQPALGASFSVVASGVAPLSYQWYYSTSGSPGTYALLSGQTSSNLTLNPPLQTSNAGSFYVTVSNSYAAVTSSVATLTVYRAPIITQQPSPTNLFLFASRGCTFSANGTGATPLNYYWTSNGTPISGATASSYTLNNLQTNYTGSYALILSNSLGTATSSVVALTVVPTPISAYAQTVITDAPAAYFRLDETSGTIAHDLMNGKNGQYNAVTLGATGYNPNDPDKAATFGPSINSYVGSVPIDFGTTGNGNISVEAWVKGNAQTTDAGIITKGTGGGGEQFNLDTGNGGSAHDFRFFVRDASGATHAANGSIAPNGAWHHVVGVCNGSAGYVALYVDGVSNASGTITVNTGLLASGNAVSIGSRQSGTTAYDDQFVGTLDEVALYNYALTPAQISNHYSVRTNVIAPPFFNSNPFTKPAAVATLGYSGSIAVNATDPGGDAMTFSKVSGPAWLSVAANGAITGTPAVSDIGTNSFVVGVIDTASLSNSATMRIVVQGLPSFPTNPFVEPQANVGQAYSGSISNSATDPDGSTLTYSKTSGPAWLNIALDGTLSGTPGVGDTGTNSFGVFAQAPNGQAASATMLLNVNGPPSFISNPFSVPDVTAGQSISGTIATNATDPNPGDTLTFAVVSGPAWLSVSGAGALSGIPLSVNVGPNSFVVSVTDSGSLSNTATLNVNVLSAPPIVSAIGLQGTNYVLSWTGGIAPYQVQSTTNISPTFWINLGSPTNGNSVIIAPTNGSAFYRIIGQ